MSASSPPPQVTHQVTQMAVLALVAAQPGSAYELSKRMQRNYHYFWPRAESRVYEQLKVLVTNRWATAKSEATGRRPRTVYNITPAGRKALSNWLRSTGAPPVFEFEGLLHVAHADAGSLQQLTSQLVAIREHAKATSDIGQQVAGEYAAHAVEQPDRAHLGMLIWKYLHLQHRAMLEWAEWALEETSGWQDTQQGSADRLRAQKFFQEVVKTSGDLADRRRRSDQPQTEFRAAGLGRSI